MFCFITRLAARWNIGWATPANVRQKGKVSFSLLCNYSEPEILVAKIDAGWAFFLTVYL
jgi:hypothetical protein